MSGRAADTASTSTSAPLRALLTRLERWCRQRIVRTRVGVEGLQARKVAVFVRASQFHAVPCSVPV